MSMYDAQYVELRELVAKFSDSEVAPLAHQIDHDANIPKALIDKLFENGSSKLESEMDIVELIKDLRKLKILL